MPENVKPPARRVDLYCHMVEMDSLVSHTLNDILVKNSSGAFLASDVIICQRHYHLRAEPELSFKFGEDSF